jgi:ankyrin repeat protein
MISILSAMHLAAHKGRHQIVKLLLEHDEVDITALSHVNHSLLLVYALVIAAEIDHENVLRLLLSREDIEVNKSNPEDGITLLMWACNKGRNDIIKMLLDKDNVEVNEKDTSHTTEMTALMFACQAGADVVEHLLE